jgi:transcription initiation factor TFIIIB Brf1 subunit/transcription initiation factor TFIIB
MAGCPVCGGPLVNDRERGEVVCAQCGLVVAESAVDMGPEWRVFEKEKGALGRRRLSWLSRRTWPLGRSMGRGGVG